MNDKLKAKNVLNNVDWRHVQAWLDIRNNAAHGKYGEYDEPKVRGMVEGIKLLVMQHPA